MADDTTTTDDDTLTLDAPAAEGDAPAGDVAAEGAATAEGGDESAAADTGEVVISLGDEPAAEEDEQARAPEWVRELRKSNREKDRRIRELEQRVQAAAPAPAAIVVGERPKLADFDFDEDAHAKALDAWIDRKAQADEQARKAREQQQAQVQAWQQRLQGYGQAKAALKVADFEEAEAVTESTLSVVQQGIILRAAKNSAALVYALGKNPKKAAELAAITDPVEFAYTIGQLEAQLKVTPRTAPPAPERRITGSAPVSGSVDSQLERLRAEAEKTGDYTKVHQYRKQLREKRT